MVLFALFIGAILIIAAVRNSQGALFAALGEDVPAFVVWAAAIFALGAIGFVPGLKPVSRGLLALVLVVLILRNYKQILSGFENTWKNPPAYAPSPASSGQTTSGPDMVTSAARSFADIFGGDTSAAVTSGTF